MITFFKKLWLRWKLKKDISIINIGPSDKLLIVWTYDDYQCITQKYIDDNHDYIKKIFDKLLGKNIFDIIIMPKSEKLSFITIKQENNKNDV